LDRKSGAAEGKDRMANDATNQAKSLASTLIFGLIGAGLVIYGRRARPGILAGIVTTTGYGLISKAVSSTIFAVLGPSRQLS
jgi:hypothetical protein